MSPVGPAFPFPPREDQHDPSPPSWAGIPAARLAHLMSGPGAAATGRWLLVSLVLAAAIPLVLFGGWVAFVTADRARSEARSAAFTTAVQVAERVAAELAKEIEVVDALGTSTALDGTDLKPFFAEAQRLAGTRPLWETVWLSDASMMQIMNLLRPLGASLALDPDPETLRRALATRQPVVGGVGPVGPLSGKRLVAIRAPVIREGELRYVLTVGLNPAAISDILKGAGAPSGWIGAIVDASGNIVARTRAEAIEAGNPAAVSAREAIARAPQGSYRGRTLEGIEVETVYRSLPGTGGWTVHFGIPRETLDAPVTRSIVMLLLGGAVSLLLAGALAALIARDLALRRQVEEERAALALRVSEERGAVAIEAAELGAWRWDAGAARVVGSPRTRALLGLPPGAGVDEWGTDGFLAAVHADDRGVLEAGIAGCLTTGAVLDIEFRSAAGRWVRATGRTVGDDRAVVHGVLLDIDPQKRAEAERRDLLRRLSEAQENEQRRIARELHDGVGQTVTGLSLGLKGLETRLEADGADEAMRGQVRWLQDLAREVGREIHQASSDLRPTALDDLGLERALTTHIAEWGRRYGVVTDVQTFGATERLPAEVETAVYRSVQEALTNALKHSGAEQVSVILDRRGPGLRVVVEDDGRGFDAGQARPVDGVPRLGLSGMRERLALVDGSVRVESVPGLGTTLFIHVPLQERAVRHA